MKEEDPTLAEVTRHIWSNAFSDSFMNALAHIYL